jgi:hypothetical protein
MKRSRANPLVAIVNRSNNVLTDYQIIRMVPALQRQITEHFQPAWGLTAQIIYAERDIPKDAYQVIVYDKPGDGDEGYLGYHFSPGGFPIASVFALEDMRDDGTISDTLSHEILEMLVDPAVNLYAYRPGHGARPARGYFYEVCDPVQCRKYDIDGHLMCNFVYPEWFEQVWARGSRRFDHLNAVGEPFEVLDGCYADVYERRPGRRGQFKTVWGPEDDAGAQRREKHRKKHRNKQRLNIRADEV